MFVRHLIAGLGLVFLAVPTLLPAQEKAPAFTPPDDIVFRTADIISEGTRMHADVYVLKSLAGSEKKLPCMMGPLSGLDQLALTGAASTILTARLSRSQG